MSEGHTPGPWIQVPGVAFVYALGFDGTNRFSIDVHPGRCGGERTPDAELIANARLIASAPTSAAQVGRLTEENGRLRAALERIAHAAHDGLTGAEMAGYTPMQTIEHFARAALARNPADAG